MRVAHHESIEKTALEADTSPETLIAHLVFSLERSAIKEVYVGSRPIVAGRHPLQETVIADFKELQKQLWQTV